MIDKKLLALLGANKKYIYYTVALMILGLFANLSITVAICRTIELAVNFQQYETARVFLLPAAIAAAGAAVRYAASRGAGTQTKKSGGTTHEEDQFAFGSGAAGRPAGRLRKHGGGG